MAENPGLVAGFKNFVLRGNVVDLAVAVVIGAAFGVVIKSIVTNLITPVVAAIFGKPDFSQALILTVNNAEFRFGAILTDILSFLAVAAAVYFVVVVPVNKLMARFASGEESVSAPDPQTELLREIRDLLAGAPAA